VIEVADYQHGYSSKKTKEADKKYIQVTTKTQNMLRAYVI